MTAVVAVVFVGVAAFRIRPSVESKPISVTADDVSAVGRERARKPKERVGEMPTYGSSSVPAT
ncbi:hypothetical protein [Haladaptatus halobius]|uniref:hypothetical protein n=1 Tax=Haladaptatus halobius TaxID=2884875 RepID=UPI001D0BD9C4|nr:hypothetical protein [Haladaptatus halobius]